MILQSFWIRKDDGGREREREREMFRRERREGQERRGLRRRLGRKRLGRDRKGFRTLGQRVFVPNLEKCGFYLNRCLMDCRHFNDCLGC